MLLGSHGFLNIALVGIPIGIFIIGVCFTIKLEALPSLALCTYVIIPRTLLAQNELTATLSPSLVILAVWIFRSLGQTNRATADAPPNRFTRTLAILLGFWCVLSLLFTFPGYSSIAWLFNFTVLVIIPLLVPTTKRCIARLEKAFTTTASVLAIYCIFEFVLKYNPISSILVHLGVPDVQHWSVYRSYGTLGHPLYAGMYFAVAFGIALGRKISGAGNRYLILAGLSLVGLMTTVSRSSIGAVAASAFLILAVHTLSNTNQTRFRGVAITTAIGFAMIGVVSSPIFQARLGSQEVLGSTNARLALTRITIQAASSHHWLGAGPGNSILGAKPFNPTQIIIENGYFQILISLGIPGLLLFIMLVAGTIIASMRNRSLASLGALVSFAVSIALFNIIESSKVSLIILGFLLLMGTRPYFVQDDVKRSAAEVSSSI